MKKERYERIEQIVADYGLSFTSVVLLCLKKLKKRISSMEFQEGNITYQDVGAEWETPHLYLSNEEKDLFLDFKKISRLSLSFLAAIAIDLYLDTIFEETVDSYRLSGYSKNKIVINNYDFYIFCWKKVEKRVEITIPPD
jgi:hypothetical protein